MVANTDAAATVERAASSVGLTTQQLLDLIFDTGIAALPPSSLVTEKYTLDDLGKRLWSEMQGQPKAGRAAWFAKLIDVQKAAVVCSVRNQGYSSEAIANDFQIDIADVVRTWNAYASKLGAQVVGLRLDAIAGQLQLAAERAQQMAIQAGDHRTYWKIANDLLDALQSIGIVDRAVHRVEVSHHLTDDKKLELDKLIELSKKEERRSLEIKVIETDKDKSDPVPVSAAKDYDDPEEFDEE